MLNFILLFCKLNDFLRKWSTFSFLLQLIVKEFQIFWLPIRSSFLFNICIFFVKKEFSICNVQVFYQYSHTGCTTNKSQAFLFGDMTLIHLFLYEEKKSALWLKISPKKQLMIDKYFDFRLFVINWQSILFLLVFSYIECFRD